MTQPKLSQVERGDRRLTTSELADIAHALQVDPLDLLDDEPFAVGIAAAARGGDVASARVGVELAVGVLRTWDLIARDGFAPTVGERPAFAVEGTNWMVQGRALAEAARQHLGLGVEPIEDLARVAADLGLVVAYRPFGTTFDSQFDGVCVASQGKGVAVIDTAGNYRGRQRFTLGHELGHWLAGDLGDTPHVDIDVMEVNGSEEESRANSFAANLLVPDAAVRAIETDTDAARIAATHRVSLLLVAFRVKNTLGDEAMFKRLKSADRFRSFREADQLAAYQDDRDAVGRSGISVAFEGAVRDALDAGALSARRAAATLPDLA